MKRFFFGIVLALSFVSNSAQSGTDPFIGEIMLVGYSYCPDKWVEADGRVLSIANNSALYSVYGCTYGGDCTSSFALPDLRGRAPIGIGAGPGLTPRELGDSGGEESVGLVLLEMPAHTHSLSDVTLTGTVQASSSAGTTNAPSGQALSDSNRTSLYSDGSLDSSLVAGSVSVTGQSGDVVASTGGGVAHNNMPPFLTMRYCVSLEGTYPVRP